MIQTHPIIVYKNIVCRNLYYIPPDEWLNEEKDTVRQVKRLLANLVEREQAEAELRKTLKKLEASQSALQYKINDLKKFEDVVIGRELKMAELEKENRELRAERLALPLALMELANRVRILINRNPLPDKFSNGSTTLPEIANLFRPCGSVVLAQVMYDSLKQSLQFGQAEMQTDEAADVACQQLNNRTLHDASLVVMRAPALKRI